jgi:ferritin-like metal-binding protein YciE
MQFDTLEDVFVHELQDLHSAETQLIAALPKMAEAAESNDLQAAFEGHLTETREQASRLESILSGLGRPIGPETCQAMKGLIKESNQAIDEHDPGILRDVALIGAAQRVEHYEMAGYGTARTLAKHLHHDEAYELLDKTLQEEGSADSKLTKLAEGGWITSGLNQEAKKQ